MSEDTKTSLEVREKELKKEFESLEAEREKLNEEGKKINQRLSEIRTRQLQLQGSYAEVKNLLGEEGVEGETPAKIKKVK